MITSASFVLERVRCGVDLPPRAGSSPALRAERYSTLRVTTNRVPKRECGADEVPQAAAVSEP
jgi:hypothetical protein